MLGSSDFWRHGAPMIRLGRTPVRGRCVLLLAGWLLAAGLHGEAIQTGTLLGVVVDSSGTSVPGVEVEVVGDQIRRSALSDDQGRFRFPALASGSYEVTAGLLGLEAKERDVAVYLGRTSEVRLTLVEGGAPASPEALGEDWIQVLAVAPLVDRFQTQVGATVSRQFLDELPVERFYQSVALLLPGVAGGGDGNPNVDGALRDANLYLIDGVDTTDPTTGLFGLNLAYEAIDTVEVSTAAVPAQYGASGAVVHVVTRSGGNDFRGNLRWLATNNSWNSDYSGNAEDRAALGSEIDAANAGPDDLGSALAAALGGPLWSQRLWFFAAYEDAARSFLRPTRQGLLWDEGTELDSASLKLDLEAWPGHTVTLQQTTDSASFAAFTPIENEPAENRVVETPSPLADTFVDRLPGDIFALQDEAQEGDFSKLQWRGAVSQNVSLAAILARQERRLERRPLNTRGLTGDAPHLGVTDFEVTPEDVEISEILAFNGITSRGFEERVRQQGNLAADIFFRTGKGDHELRAGVDVQETTSERNFNFPGRAGIDRATGRQVEGQLFLDVDTSRECFLEGRCLPFDPATGAFQPFQLFNFWRRPNAETRQESTALFVTDAISFGRFFISLGLRWEQVRGRDETFGRPLFRDDSLSPRLAVKLDPIGDGRTLLSAAWSRIDEPFLQKAHDAFVRAEVFSGFTEYTWRDLPGSDCDATDLDTPCWQPTGGVGLFPVQVAEPNLSLGRAAADELVIGFERQLTRSTALRLHWIDRRWRDLWDNVLDVVDDDLVSTLATLPQAERRYSALQLLIQKRFADRWQLLGSYTRGEAEGNLFQSDGLATFADFARLADFNLVNRFGPAPYDRSDQIQLFGNYQVPLARADLSFGTAVRYQTGTPYQVEQPVEDFGTFFLTPRGSLRLPDVLRWDLSLAVDLRASAAVDVELKLEAFNISNEQVRLGVETNASSERFGLPRSIADLDRPRSYRVTLGLRF